MANNFQYRLMQSHKDITEASYSKFLYAIYRKHLEGIAEAKYYIYFRVTIDCKFTFTKHVDIACKKALAKPQVLSMPHKGHDTECCSYIRPILEYTAVVWAPSMTLL